MQKELLVITGATGGLGSEIASYFASLSLENTKYRPVYCCRNEVKAFELKKRIERLGLQEKDYSVFLSDLSTKQGVEDLIDKIFTLKLPVRYFVNNAASMFKSYIQNEEGIEMNMAVNFLAAARCAELIIPRLVEGASLVNILSVSRNWYALPKDFMRGSSDSYTRLGGYCRSKRALSVFTADMAERYPSLYINGVDPGVMNTPMLKMEKWFDPLTDLFFRPFTRKPAESLAAVMAACENRDKVSGHIFTTRKHFPIEKKTVLHPYKAIIREFVLKSLMTEKK